MITREKAIELRALLVKAAESLSDSDALEAKEFYDYWKADVFYKKGTRLRHDDKLWRVMQDHTSQGQYPPSIYTASLYSEVEKPGQGDTPDNPIPYNNNMELLENKYYSQLGVVYRCIRDTGVPIYNNLADLVGIYVEFVEQ